MMTRLMVQLPPKPVAASLDKRICDNHFSMVESNKQQIKEVTKLKRKTRKQRELLSEFGIAPPSVSRDRRIKMKK